MTTGPSQSSGNNLLWNGTFDGRAVRPWSVGFENSRQGRGALDGGELCVSVDQAGPEPFSVTVRQSPLAVSRGHHYQVRFRAHATVPTKIRPKVSTSDAAPKELWSSLVTASPAATTYTGTFDGPIDNENAELVFDLGGPLAGPVPLTVCFDDIELNDPQFQPPIERTHPISVPAVRLNQVGYLPTFAKTATLSTDASDPLDWQLMDAKGTVKATGKTRPFGADRSSGDNVHIIDFTSFPASGTGWKLRVGDDESYPFEIGGGVYRKMKYDALSFFYLQRSGVPIVMPYAGNPAYERPAGHPGDQSVPCAPDAKCNYSLDVSGGWYDAGDHGKYIVSSAITVWTLQNQYELLGRFGTTAADFGDGRMNIPEAGNRRPDLLDEARFNLDFMLRMQVPPGRPLAGMVHQKIHGEKWSDIPTLPHLDPIQRFVRPVSTAATYEFAAATAQAARLWRKIDPSFADKCLRAAEAAFTAAKAHPMMRADGPLPGGGAYGDGDVSDDLYWAASELFITTGKAAYKADIVESKFHAPKPAPVTSGILGWDHVNPMAKLSLAVVPNGLGDVEIADQRRQLVEAADRFLKVIEKRGYRMPVPSDTAYTWGSNSGVLNAGLILGTAYYFTKDVKYANGVIECMNYILGRNPLGMSYVAGYGTRAMRNPHHRIWAHQKDPKLPEAPPGTITGGPNSLLQDPYIRRLGKSGCPPQTCYVDHVDSYSTNEVAINYNAALAWNAAFLDDIARGRETGGNEVSKR